MKSVNYDVKCLSCSADVGQIVYGSFVQHPGPSAPVTRRGGRLRCSHCGGSLCLEPIDVRSSIVDQAAPAARIAAEAAKQRSQPGWESSAGLVAGAVGASGLPGPGE